MGERCDNYDAETAARLEVLDAGVRAGARHALVLLDATSPVEASKRFRQRTVRSRARRRLDQWLGALLVMEDEYDTVSVTYVLVGG